jgi:hypothetical protein
MAGERFVGPSEVRLAAVEVKQERGDRALW